MLKWSTREEVYMACSRLIQEVNLHGETKGKYKQFSQDIRMVAIEMKEILDQIPQLERAVKLEGLVKDLYNHLENF